MRFPAATRGGSLERGIEGLTGRRRRIGSKSERAVHPSGLKAATPWLSLRAIMISCWACHHRPLVYNGGHLGDERGNAC
jgi:hypothetical protein